MSGHRTKGTGSSRPEMQAGLQNVLCMGSHGTDTLSDRIQIHPHPARQLHSQVGKLCLLVGGLNKARLQTPIDLQVA